MAVPAVLCCPFVSLLPRFTFYCRNAVRFTADRTGRGRGVLFAALRNSDGIGGIQGISGIHIVKLYFTDPKDGFVEKITAQRSFHSLIIFITVIIFQNAFVKDDINIIFNTRKTNVLKAFCLFRVTV